MSLTRCSRCKNYNDLCRMVAVKHPTEPDRVRVVCDSSCRLPDDQIVGPCITDPPHRIAEGVSA